MTIETKISEKLYSIALNTFELTCFMFPMEEGEEYEGTDTEGDQPGYLITLVQFEGAAKGALVFSSSSRLANAIAANMLGVEEATKHQIESALCEIANIICGNLVPLFAKDNEICFIRPPKVVARNEDPEKLFQNMTKHSIHILLDEGVADISIFYNYGSQND